MKHQCLGPPVFCYDTSFVYVTSYSCRSLYAFNDPFLKIQCDRVSFTFTHDVLSIYQAHPENQREFSAMPTRWLVIPSSFIGRRALITVAQYNTTW